MDYYLLNIAVDLYENDKWPNLNNAVSDSKRLENILLSKYGFQNISDPLYNGQATRENIIEALNHLSNLVSENDSLLINFAGHGSMNPKTGIGYWIPSDSNHSISSYIPNSTIIELIYGIEAKHILIISDSCFSGSFLNSFRSSENFHYNKLIEKKSRHILSSGRDEPVKDGQPGNGSPFANSLIDFLEANNQEFISFVELHSYVAKRTGSTSKQQPIACHIEGAGHEGGQFVFRNINYTPSIQKVNGFETFVVPYETAIKLRDLNIPQESYLAYYQVEEKILIKKNESVLNFICSAFFYEEVAKFIPELIDVNENTYLAKSNRYDKIYKEEWESWELYSATIQYQKTFVKDTPYIAICKSIGYMVAFSMTDDGKYNNLFTWGYNQAECAALMLIELHKENKLHKIMPDEE